VCPTLTQPPTKYLATRHARHAGGIPPSPRNGSSGKSVSFSPARIAAPNSRTAAGCRFNLALQWRHDERGDERASAASDRRRGGGDGGDHREGRRPAGREEVGGATRERRRSSGWLAAACSPAARLLVVVGAPLCRSPARCSARPLRVRARCCFAPLRRPPRAHPPPRAILRSVPAQAEAAPLRPVEDDVDLDILMRELARSSARPAPLSARSVFLLQPLAIAHCRARSPLLPLCNRRPPPCIPELCGGGMTARSRMVSPCWTTCVSAQTTAAVEMSLAAARTAYGLCVAGLLPTGLLPRRRRRRRLVAYRQPSGLLLSLLAPATSRPAGWPGRGEKPYRPCLVHP